MRIGIDCKSILNTKNGEFAGVGHYTYFLIKELLVLDKENQYVLFFYDPTLDTSEFEQANVTIVRMPYVSKKKFLPFIFSHILVAQVYRHYKCDVIHYPAPVRPLFYFGKMVTTVHDLAAYQHPEWFPKLNGFFTKYIIPASLHRAKKIIAVSKTTKEYVEKLFQISEEKIEVIYDGVLDYSNYTINQDNLFIQPKNIIPYFLFVGTIEPRKNLVNLILAYEEFLKKYVMTTMRLVIAGRKGWKYDPVFELINKPTLKDKVIYVGYVNIDEKIALYKNAFALVYPSFFEGFGMQLLEAMNLNVPILTSNEGAISEVVLDNAVFVEPTSVQSIFEGMIKMYEDNDLRKRLIDHGIDIAQNYTWAEGAKRTLEVYKEVYEMKN